jgi:hypothetical protein
MRSQPPSSRQGAPAGSKKSSWFRKLANM